MADEDDLNPTVEIESPPLDDAPGGAEATPESPPDPVEQEARDAGWKPKEEWKGQPERWVDAATFVQNRNHVLPIIKRENQSLKRQLEALSTQLAELQAERDERGKQQDSYRLESLKLQRQQALEEGDHAKVNLLDAQLIDEAVKARTAPTKPAVDPNIKAVWEDFAENNPWIADDSMKRILEREMRMLRAAGEQSTGQEFLDVAVDRVKRIYPDRFPRQRSAMAENGGRSGAPMNGTRSWNDLKPDVAAQLDNLIQTTPGLTRAAVLKNCEAEHFRR